MLPLRAYQVRVCGRNLFQLVIEKSRSGYGFFLRLSMLAVALTSSEVWLEYTFV